MSRFAYVNGRYLPHADATVHVEDRGYQFADGVYEVCEVAGGRLVDAPRHLARLQRSLGELRIRAPMSLAALSTVMREVIHRNRVRDGLVYVQVTRGVARRDHAFPVPEVVPSVVVTARALGSARREALAAHGIDVITVPENRWQRVDIKSTSLLPNVLARQAAREQGAYEAWFVSPDGFITEGASSNAWIVTAEGRVVTRPTDGAILAGVTRAVVADVLASLQITLEERPFTAEEARAAPEAFVTSCSQTVMPVVRIDGHTLGEGRPGPLTQRLREEFRRFAQVS
ncbi:MAG: D-amino-acid transaminase [Xanthobacteraceae bacterium]